MPIHDSPGGHERRRKVSCCRDKEPVLMMQDSGVCMRRWHGLALGSRRVRRLWTKDELSLNQKRDFPLRVCVGWVDCAHVARANSLLVRLWGMHVSVCACSMCTCGSTAATLLESSFHTCFLPTPSERPWRRRAGTAGCTSRRALTPTH